MKRNLLALTVILALTTSFAFADKFAEIENRVVEHTLKNGMKFIILERHEAPIVAFNLIANVGSVNEVKGITGVAHMFEHMAFKGTKSIGTKDYEKERSAMQKEDEIFAKLRAERLKGSQADPEIIRRLQEELERAKAEAKSYVVENEFGRIIEQAGGVGLNAGTGFDITTYIYSFPSNKLELWMSLESERFMGPVLREFYQEKEVVAEERRMRVENQPIGKLVDEFTALAYKAHPYGQSPIGYISDLAALSREQALEFYRKHYSPNNLTAAIVGDVEPQEVMRLAELYFGRLPNMSSPEPLVTVEPPQLGEKRLEIEDPSQPAIIIGYHKPDAKHPDDAVFDAITDLLAGGRTSRLYKKLVKEKKISLTVGAFPGYPGYKYPGLFIFFALPAKGHSNAECEAEILAEIERMKDELVSLEELEPVKTRAKAALVRALDSNSGMASLLCYSQVITGDWKNLFKQLDKINKVTPEDIKRVMNQYFEKSNRTVAQLVTTKD